jgi:hypothetical protein
MSLFTTTLNMVGWFTLALLLFIGETVFAQAVNIPQMVAKRQLSGQLHDQLHDDRPITIPSSSIKSGRQSLKKSPIPFQTRGEQRLDQHTTIARLKKSPIPVIRRADIISSTQPVASLRKSPIKFQTYNVDELMGKEGQSSTETIELSRKTPPSNNKPAIQYQPDIKPQYASQQDEAKLVTINLPDVNDASKIQIIEEPFQEAIELDYNTYSSLTKLQQQQAEQQVEQQPQQQPVQQQAKQQILPANKEPIPEVEQYLNNLKKQNEVQVIEEPDQPKPVHRITATDLQIPPLLPVSFIPADLDLPERRLVSLNTYENIPLKDILVAIAKDLDINYNIDPAIDDGLILNTKKQPLYKLVKNLERDADIQFHFGDNFLSITKAKPVFRVYSLPISDPKVWQVIDRDLAITVAKHDRSSYWLEPESGKIGLSVPSSVHRNFFAYVEQIKQTQAQDIGVMITAIASNKFINIKDNNKSTTKLLRDIAKQYNYEVLENISIQARNNQASALNNLVVTPSYDMNADKLYLDILYNENVKLNTIINSGETVLMQNIAKTKAGMPVSIIVEVFYQPLSFISRSTFYEDMLMKNLPVSL